MFTFVSSFCVLCNMMFGRNITNMLAILQFTGKIMHDEYT